MPSYAGSERAAGQRTLGVQCADLPAARRWPGLGDRVFSAVVVAWQVRGDEAGTREARAVRMIGVSFFALAAHLAAERGAP